VFDEKNCPFTDEATNFGAEVPEKNHESRLFFVQGRVKPALFEQWFGLSRFVPVLVPRGG